MKGQKNNNWEFHGFSSNPEKSFEAGKKGSRLAVEASIRKIDNNQQSPGAESKTASKTSAQNKTAKSKNWQSAAASSSKTAKKDESSSKE